MSDTQSKIDSLQELNSQLIATIAELRKENAEVKAENTKLKQTDKIRSRLYKAYMEETGLDPWIKSETSESLQSENADNHIL
ncbi:12798_t:CDS:2 [Ambispora gerdemannii]|uniref:12798_t:CDS:1 n=1 Tax=Ambispora gerdemannii TaxID=144530 RepID=A0A9N9BUB9_9GLOM|nr:12798_t:CDS:2 [Ambispora gerdemannii]